ncbi:hypothetical protein TVAG_564410 [Trichomonas vaginalis G3]|uniref:Uncharacterized protein n=1 Tax=Trichomonas vaginalis (strain ATCC PRA-98 / G3) TaxID=412133 RepID=A2H9W7_TRIV3|nr:hypothetical protein TVAG_564410 [Trichomonas vaginalis G3]|eukprot:XP_001286731.1 hypothetical protein [Trichomonas vaginalis G3]
MYVSYKKNDGTQVKVPLDNNCYLNLYGDEKKKYLRVYEMADMTLPDPAPAHIIMTMEMTTTPTCR